MTDDLINVVFEAEISIEVARPFDSDVVKQLVQNEIGHTGAVVTEVLIAEGASDL